MRSSATSGWPTSQKLSLLARFLLRSSVSRSAFIWALSNVTPGQLVSSMYLDASGSKQRGGFSAGAANSDPCSSVAFVFRTASMIVRGSIRSWTWSDTVGTWNEICSALPDQESWGSRCGSWA